VNPQSNSIPPTFGLNTPNDIPPILGSLQYL
jgi:hypothetical protein